MPQEEVTSPFRVRWNQVTWYSKLGAIIVFLGLIPGLSFYVGMQYRQIRDAADAPLSASETRINSPKSDYTTGIDLAQYANPDDPKGDFAKLIQTFSDSGYQNATELINEYANSKFKVIDIVPNTKDPNKDSVLYVVTTRGVNDSSCGSRYNQPVCFFFIENTYADTAPITFAGMWYGGLSGYGKGSFIDDHTFQFTEGAGDAGSRWSGIVNLDVLTGSTTIVKPDTEY